MRGQLHKDYNQIAAEGVDPFILETDILANQIEDPAAAPLDLVRAGKIPDEQGRLALLNFIAMQALRVPNRRAALVSFHAQIACVA